MPPIVAMTAGVMDGTRQACIEVGMNDYLAKPVKPEDLERLLRRWCPDAFGATDERGEATED